MTELTSLEGLMSEFFSPTTGNERKRDIEEMLGDFDKRLDAWRYALYFIDNTNNQYVSMFGLTTLDNVINRGWCNLSHADKNELRCTLWKRFTTTNSQTPSFVRNKLSKLIVDIARHEWPSSYPMFFNEIIELMESNKRMLTLGLVMVQSFVEGLGVTAATESRVTFLPQERRKELQQLFYHCIPQLITILIETLDKFAAEKSPDRKCSNPPPSPERDMGSIEPSTSTTLDLPDLLVSSNPIHSRTFIYDKEECIKISLAALQHIFSCLPQGFHFQQNIIPSIFHWANVSTQTEFDEDVCIIGMSVVNEMLYQRHGFSGNINVPALTHETLKLLHHLTTPSHAPPLTSLCPMYIDKISEYLQLFISLYFKRIESAPDFDPIGFLYLIFQYTFQVPLCSNFINTLDIWIRFIDTLKPQDSLRYSDALLGFVGQVINKIQFQNNSNQLQHLDQDTLNDDGETEWQLFLKNCIEAVSKVAELAPLHIFKLIQDMWHRLADMHDNQTASHNELIDLASFTQLLGRLAPTLFQDKENVAIDQCISQAVSFLERLMVLLNYANNFSANDNSSPIVSNARSQVFAGILACLGSWSYFMPRCSAPTCTVTVLLQTASSLLIFKNGSVPQSPLLCHAAAHMILSVVLSVRPVNPLPCVADLYLQAQRSLSHLQPKTASVVRQALCIMILECPVDTSVASENVDGKRLYACSALIEAWCSSLLTPAPAAGSPCRRLSCLPALCHLLNYFSDHPTQTKKLLAAAVERPVQAALEVFQNYYDASDADKDTDVIQSLLDFFLALIHSLHQQLGATFIRNSIHLFLNTAKRKEHGALLQLLKMFQAAVEGGTLSNTSDLSEVLSMCIEHILPLVQSNSVDGDVDYALFDLFGSILLNRWQHFYSSCVRQGWSPVAPEGAGDGAKIGQLSHFRAIMYAMSKTFMTENIEVVRLNLRTLDCLNIRYKLYSKVLFRQELLSHFLGILLGILVQCTAVATLLQEEICSTCYCLAAVDFAVYFDSFLPSFLATIPALSLNDIQKTLIIPRDTDLPTFTQNLLRFAYDIRCYQVMKETI